MYTRIHLCVFVSRTSLCLFLQKKIKHQQKITDKKKVLAKVTDFCSLPLQKYWKGSWNTYQNIQKYINMYPKERDQVYCTSKNSTLVPRTLVHSLVQSSTLGTLVPLLLELQYHSKTQVMDDVLFVPTKQGGSRSGECIYISWYRCFRMPWNRVFS